MKHLGIFLSLSLLMLSALIMLSSLSPGLAAEARFKLTSEKPFHSVSESNVQTAHCTRKIPFTDGEMREWLRLKAHLPSSTHANVFGIELVDESPYLIQLLTQLLMNDRGFSGPQKTYISQCSKVDCAVSELFGEKVGLRLLFMLSRYGFNGSSLRVKNASPWWAEELDQVLLSLSDLPEALIPSDPLAFNYQLTHFNRADDPTQPNESQPMANAMIFLFDGWSIQPAALQRYVLFHELGHAMDGILDLGTTPAWFRASGWIVRDLSWELVETDKTISGYAEYNPLEDFAESFAAYRYNPDTLKRMNPRIYSFLKRKVFRQVEYTSESGCAPRTGYLNE